MKGRADAGDIVARIVGQNERLVHVEEVSIGLLNIDMAPDGTIYGIELLNANEHLRGGDDGRIVVVDEGGEEPALTLAPQL